MSPDITPSARPFFIRSAGAARILTDSVNAAHATGLTVTTDADLGVVCLSSASPTWAPDPHAYAVSVLGAVLLAHQPPIVGVDQALAHVFGSRPEFVQGIEDGVSGKAAPEVADALYGDWYFLGVQLRTLVATVPCALHAVRFPRGQRCPRCAAGVPVARPYDEPTQPVQVDTPRSVAAHVIGEMTLAQALDVVADSVPARGMSVDDAAEWTEVLRELAQEARKDGQ